MHAKQTDDKDRINSESTTILENTEEGFWSRLFSVCCCCCTCEDTTEDIQEEVSEIDKIGPQRPIDAGKKTLVLELDQILVYSTSKKISDPDMVLSVKTDQELIEEIYILKRPGLADFLSKVASMYEVIIYTSGLQQLSEPLIGALDEKKVIAYSLYRDHCEKIDGKIVKDLKILNRDLKNVILMKSSANNATLQPENCISIKPFMGEKDDKELSKILGLLNFLRYVMDVRPCRIWEKQYNENQKLMKKNLHMKAESLSVLREMPTLEDRADSPGIVFQVRPNNALLQKENLELGRRKSIFTPEKVGKFKFDEADLAKAGTEPEADSNAQEIPVDARQDVEFVLRRPRIQQKKLSVVLKKMHSAPGDKTFESNEVELSAGQLSGSPNGKYLQLKETSATPSEVIEE